MICRFGVKSALKGGKLPYKAKDKDVVIVYDMAKKDYRAVPLDGIIEVRCGGTTHFF